MNLLLRLKWKTWGMFDENRQCKQWDTVSERKCLCVCVYVCRQKSAGKTTLQDTEEWTAGQWLVQNGKQQTQKVTLQTWKIDVKISGCGNAIPRKAPAKKKQGRKNEPMAATVFEMRSNKREIVFAIYETHGNVQRQLELELKMLFHLSFVHFCIAFYFEIGEETVTETGGDRTTFQTEYTITAMNNINLIWTSALDRAKKWRCFAKRRFSV